MVTTCGMTIDPAIKIAAINKGNSQSYFAVPHWHVLPDQSSWREIHADVIIFGAEILLFF